MEDFSRLKNQQSQQTQRPVELDAAINSEEQSKGVPYSPPDRQDAIVKMENVNVSSMNKGHVHTTMSVMSEAVKGEYSYGKLGLLLGISSIIGGVILGLNGVAGSTSWTAKLLGLESSINDAAPGVVLFIVGLFMVWTTKPRVHLKDIK